MYKLKELLDMEKLPEEVIILTNKETKKKGLFGIKINYSIQQVRKAELKTGGFSKKESWVGSYSNATRKEYHQPEMAIMGLILECLEKTVHPTLILHRLKKQVDKFIEENPLKEKEVKE